MTPKKTVLVILGLLSSCASAPRGSLHASAPLPLTECQAGATRLGFLSPVTEGDVPCATGSQTCAAGKWSGPALYDTCDSFTKGCEGMPHGSVVTGYEQPTVSAGMPCIVATKTCLNGVWNGPEVFPSCTAVP